MRDMGVIRVTRAPGAPSRGLMTLSGRVFACALDKGGIAAMKHEADGVTPLGVWLLRRVAYRPASVGSVVAVGV